MEQTLKERMADVRAVGRVEWIGVRPAREEPMHVSRNVVIAGVNLVALKSLRFAIGDEVILEGTGPCEPCAKMDVALGDGGFQAVRGHGGITTRVIRTGIIRLGDSVRVVS